MNTTANINNFTVLYDYNATMDKTDSSLVQFIENYNSIFEDIDDENSATQERAESKVMEAAQIIN